MKKIRIIIMVLAIGFIVGSINIADAISYDENYIVIVHHPTDATKYYILDNGIWFEQQCPHGLVYDCITQTCTFPGWGCNCISEEEETPPPTGCQCGCGATCCECGGDE